MDPNKTAIIIVDVQERFVPVINDIDRLLKEARIILKGGKLLGLPIITTTQYKKGLGDTVEDLAEFVDEDRNFNKMEYSFAIEPVMEALKEENIENVIITGIETHICVFQGSRALKKAGYEVYLPIGAVSSRTVENKENALEQLRDLGCIITNTETILFDLLQTADHEHFKAISALIK